MYFVLNCMYCSCELLTRIEHSQRAEFITRIQLKCDGTRWRTGSEVKGKLANRMCSQYPSHYLGTWCVHQYYRRCAHLCCQYSIELTNRPIRIGSSLSPKDEIWFLHLSHHISTGHYDLLHCCPFSTEPDTKTQSKERPNSATVPHMVVTNTVEDAGMKGL